tara:strand:+ start:6166 stop:6648 length:483 start_codon:yes stop_codon:yes gene_type:complete
MGRDDSILILRFKYDTKEHKSVYIVIWTQSVENFLEYEYINKFLSKNNCSLWHFTKTLQSALRIAQKMYLEREKPQYGIKMIDTNISLEEFGGSITHSPLVGSPKNLKVVKFEFNDKKYELNQELSYFHFQYYQNLPKPKKDGYKPLEIKNLEEFFLSSN